MRKAFKKCYVPRLQALEFRPGQNVLTKKILCDILIDVYSKQLNTNDKDADETNPWVIIGVMIKNI